MDKSQCCDRFIVRVVVKENTELMPSAEGIRNALDNHWGVSGYGFEVEPVESEPTPEPSGQGDSARLQSRILPA